MVQATFVATLVDEWARLGLVDAVVCPGSRSSPLALAFARHCEVCVHVRIDERSAAFFALGRALLTRRPVAIVVTSGTAAAELLAAVAEADLARVPLLVLTADRPPELHGVGAPQTIDQRHLYGAKVRGYEEPGVARLEAAASWRPLAQRTYSGARGDGGIAGPVHLNVAFVEPLLADALALPQSRGGSRPPDVPARANALDVEGKRVLCVAGAGTTPEMIADARALNWALVGDATARGSIAYGDPLVRHEEIWSVLCPEVIIRVGGVPASKFLAQRLVASDVEVVGLEGAGPVADPDGVISRRMAGLPDPANRAHRGDASYLACWDEASAWLGQHLVDAFGDVLDEVVVARVVVETANVRNTPLVVGSSMPVRDVEWWAPPRECVVVSNRGANGIDGVVSTFLGVAQGSSAIGLVGDVTMLHDVSALVDGAGDNTRAVLVVSDNGGGGIFSFLAQAHQVGEEQFETLFGTPRHHDLVAVAKSFGHHGLRVSSVAQLRQALDEGLQRVGLTVVVACVPSRPSNVARHHELNTLVGQWWATR